jgi:hypothetical protein
MVLVVDQAVGHGCVFEGANLGESFGGYDGSYESSPYESSLSEVSPGKICISEISPGNLILCQGKPAAYVNPEPEGDM